MKRQNARRAGELIERLIERETGHVGRQRERPHLPR